MTDWTDIDDVVLPGELAAGVDATPEFSTSVAETLSGWEQRVRHWALPRGRWTLGYGWQRPDAIRAAVRFFADRGGRHRAFWMQDPMFPELEDEPTIPLGDGLHQLALSFGVQQKPIFRVDEASVLVRIDGVPQASGWSMGAGGKLQFTDTSVNDDVTVDAIYYLPVRFLEDRTAAHAYIQTRASRWDGLQIIEVRAEDEDDLS